MVGDALVYKILVQLKEKYAKELDWLLPYMGDWHLLLNYGKTLMKIYQGSGLEELVCKYHKGATATTVLEGNSFDKTLNFLLKAGKHYTDTRLGNI